MFIGNKIGRTDFCRFLEFSIVILENLQLRYPKPDFKFALNNTNLDLVNDAVPFNIKDKK